MDAHVEEKESHRVFMEFVCFGLPRALVKSSPGSAVERVAIDKRALVELRRAAKLARSSRVMYVSAVARGDVDDLFWSIQSSSEKSDPLKRFVDKIDASQLSLEVHSLALDFTDATRMNAFRALDTQSRSVVCAALFNVYADANTRKKCNLLIRGCDEDLLVWREMQLVVPTSEELSVLPTGKSSVITIEIGHEGSLSRSRLCHTARSITSLLRWEIRNRFGDNILSWVLYINSNDSPLDLSSVEQGPRLVLLHDQLRPLLLGQKWTARPNQDNDNVFVHKRPVFVVICPAHVAPWAGRAVNVFLKEWNIPSPDDPNVISVSDSFRSDLPDSFSTIIMEKAKACKASVLSLRGCGLSSWAHLPMLQRIVGDMSELKELDLSFNQLDGDGFHRWIVEWVSGGSERRAILTGNADAKKVKHYQITVEAAEK